MGHSADCSNQGTRPTPDRVEPVNLRSTKGTWRVEAQGICCNSWSAGMWHYVNRSGQSLDLLLHIS